MKLKIINPAIGISDSDINSMRTYLTRFLRPETVIEFENISHGFPSVETEAQGIINGSEALKLVRKAQGEGYQGIFINCFDDPGVVAAREVSDIPVLGPYEPSVLLASMLSDRVAVISTDEYGVICEERKKRIHRTENRIYKIVNVGLTVLELTDHDRILNKLYQCCDKLASEQVGAVVLGCTGMNRIVDALTTSLQKNGIDIQIVEPLRIGVTTLEYLLHTGYKNMIHSTKI